MADSERPCQYCVANWAGATGKHGAVLVPAAHDCEMSHRDDQGIEIRLRINDVTYVGLEGGKDTRGNVVKLATFRSWSRART